MLLTFHQKMKGKHFLLDRNNGCRHMLRSWSCATQSYLNLYFQACRWDSAQCCITLENILVQDVTNPIFNTHSEKMKEHLAGKTTHNNRERGHCVAFCSTSQRWLPFSLFLCPLHHLCICLFSSLALSEPSTQASFVSGSSSSFSRHFLQQNTHIPISKVQVIIPQT